MGEYFEIGEWVEVASDNDNDNYDAFRGRKLKIIHVATNTNEHLGYDNCMGGMPLYDLEDEEGNIIPCSLYAYELEYAK
jgi:hypothetical protein